MRLKIDFQFTENSIPLDYRRKFLSLIKHGLEKVNPQLFDELFLSNKQKDYTFAVFLRNPIFKKEEIELGSTEGVLNFSTGNAELGVNFYNAFCEIRNKNLNFYKENQIILKNIQILSVPDIRNEQVYFKLLSPLIIKSHNRETYKDRFYYFADTEFEQTLKNNLFTKLRKRYGDYVEKDIQLIQFDTKQMKKTVVEVYGMKVVCSIGILGVSGKPYLLNEMLQNGIGSNSGSGFGFVEI
ncbi:CRISPR-associated endoribonuclease Cas6 [Listeria fleischmannii]|uniref:CRISPR-associated endoribonuclease Cas6 n=1 Tax=Listeria fleischmannii TaxID=1069827 RepID=UPI0016288438|nr:CRISPR-associated endoribonuclease Cas6 [Listeria fleischmannii]MBC1418948.1 CRISPR-associated endoribonuclease Cas6 [Listeria fleischmannii]